MLHKGFLKTSFFFGALSVILGAWNAHALKKILTPESREIFETGVKYQFYHVFALFIVGILYRCVKSNFVVWAGRCFVAGIFLFCGSLYLMAFLLPDGRNIGIITPIGGALFIAGWLLLLYGTSKINDKDLTL